MKSRTPLHGFTQTVLLAVLLVLFVIGMLLAPHFHNAQLKGRDIVCVSNLRQVHRALREYRQGHNNRMPPTLADILPNVEKVHLFCFYTRREYDTDLKAYVS